MSAASESLMNPEGRFRTLRGVVPEVEALGMPRFTVGRWTADFPVEMDGERYLLRVPVARSDTGAGVLAAFAAETLSAAARYVAGSVYLSREMLVFCADGRAVWTDIVLERLPSGVPIADFVRMSLRRTAYGELRRLLSNLGRMCAVLGDCGMVHGHIHMADLLVTDDLQPVAMRYVHPLSRRGERDMASLLRVAVAAYVSACEPDAFRMLWYGGDDGFATATALSVPRTGGVLSRALERLGGHGAEPDRSEVCNMLEAIAREPFHPFEALAGHVAGDDTAPVSITAVGADRYGADGGTGVAVRWDMCEYVGRMADTLIRYRMDGKWGFACADGRRLECGPFDYAGDFYEGRAAVCVAGGYGLIDRGGAYVMEPEFEALEWYGPADVVTACTDGVWHLYDRCGRMLTAECYDWMGEPSEG